MSKRIHERVAILNKYYGREQLFTSPSPAEYRLQLIGLRLLIILGIILLISGCTTSQSAQLGKGAASYGLRDSKGEILTLTQKPQRIVSLGIAMDEILIELVPLDSIAALTYLADDIKISNITEQAKKVPNRVIANGEVIAYLHPDLVLVADWQPIELIQILRDAGIPVYVYKAPKSIKQIKELVMEIALVVGETESGTRIVANMDNELARIATKVEKIPTAQQRIVMRYSTMGVTGGKDSSFDDICKYAGVKNGASLAGLGASGQLSKEQILQVNPDVFVLPVLDRSNKNIDMQKFRTDLLQDPALQTVKAIQQGNLVNAPDAHLVCTSQYIIDAVKDVFDAAYPSLQQ